jgi:dipeptidyl aminopeptidase/acylaminoacyl peptidase
MYKLFALLILAGQMCSTALAQTNPALPAKDTSIPPKYSLEDFGELPLLEAPQLSPNGQYFAARINVNGQSLLGTMQIGDPANKIHLLGEGKSEIGWFRWVTDERLAISINAQDNIEGIPVVVTRLLSADRYLKNIIKLNWPDGAISGDDVVHWPKGSDTKILMQTRKTFYTNEEGYAPTVDRVDVVTGKTTVVQNSRGEIDRWYTDAAGVVRMGYGYDYETNRARIIYRKGFGDSWLKLDSVDYDKDERILSPVQFPVDPNKLIVLAQDDNREALFEYDIAARQYGTKLFSHPKYDIDHLIYADDGDTILGVAYIDDSYRIHWFDEELKALQSKIDSSIGRRRAYIVSQSADRSRMIFALSSAKFPTNYFLFDKSDGVLRPISRNGEKLRKYTLAEGKAISYKARDGLEITGYLTLPVGREARNLPLIMLPHGGPYARDTLDYDFIVQFLANRGYAVLQPNFRGSTGFGSDFTDKGKGQWGRAMQDDLTDGVAWLASQSIIDPKRVCIAGGSYGGYAAMFGLVRDPALYKCAISFAGVSDIPAMLRYDRNYTYYKRWKKDIVGQGQDNGAVSAINNIDKIVAPLLLVHGKKDLRVPYNQSSSMYKKMIAAKKSVEFITLPEGDHHFSRSQDRMTYLRAVEAFLTKYNPAD